MADILCGGTSEPDCPQTLIDILNIRNSQPVGGFNPINFIELYGGQLVEIIANEPDATTFRGSYYYNSRLNKLYKKLATKPFPVWKQVS